jgi:hypothetical protein
MTDCFNKDINVSQPDICEFTHINPETKEETTQTLNLYNWMQIRSSNESHFKSVVICDSLEMGGDINLNNNEIQNIQDLTIEGDLTVNGNINGNITVPPPNQGQIPCIEITADLTANPQNDWQPPNFTNEVTTIVINSMVENNTDISGIVSLGQCYVILFNNTGKTLRLMADNNPANTSAPENRFRINATTILPLNPNEAIQIYYCHTIERWIMISHL